MALARCILGTFLGVGCHCFSPPLDVPTFSARCLHVQRRERTLVAEGGTLRGRETFLQILSRIRLPRNCRDHLYAANLRHETDGFTSPPKEGVLRTFSARNIQEELFLDIPTLQIWDNYYVATGQCLGPRFNKIDSLSYTAPTNTITWYTSCYGIRTLSINSV
jgi:hypothetical protein